MSRPIRYLALLGFLVATGVPVGIIVGAFGITGWDYAIGFVMGAAFRTFDQWLQDGLDKGRHNAA